MTLQFGAVWRKKHWVWKRMLLLMKVPFVFCELWYPKQGCVRPLVHNKENKTWKPKSGSISLESPFLAFAIAFVWHLWKIGELWPCNEVSLPLVTQISTFRTSRTPAPTTRTTSTSRRPRNGGAERKAPRTSPRSTNLRSRPGISSRPQTTQWLRVKRPGMLWKLQPFCLTSYRARITKSITHVPRKIHVKIHAKVKIPTPVV